MKKKFKYFTYDEKKMQLRMLSKTQCSKCRHTNDDAKWKSSMETPLEQRSCRRLHEIQYATQYDTTMKTPR